MSYHFNVNYLSTCNEVVNEAIQRFNHDQCDSKLFILKVTGQEEYLFGNYSLIQYKVGSKELKLYQKY